MQTSTRSRDPGASFAARKGHLPQLSISDETHHVTEAIGFMYGDDNETDMRSHSLQQQQRRPHHNHRRRPSNPDHHVMQQPEITLNGNHMPRDITPRRRSIPRKQLPPRDPQNAMSIEHQNGGSQSFPALDSPPDSPAPSASTKPSSRQRSPSETATSHFPLNDIEYESSPAAVAQELSNLQALRRMSMSVGATDDPDLPQLNAAAMPGMPSSSASEDDSSRLFWVPARLHPELAPKEFKSFLDSKVEQIRRRSGELSTLSSPNSSRSNSLKVDEGGGGLRRKKSMLSRQINSSVGYQDGADRLERKKSQSRRTAPNDPNLQELENLVAHTVGLTKPEVPLSPPQEATPDVILPSVPGSSLKRSTRTTYRRGGGGSLKGKGSDRATYAQRAARRTATMGSLDPVSDTQEAVPAIPALPSFGWSEPSEESPEPSRGQSTSPSKTAPTNFSRPAGREPSPPSSVGHASQTPSSFESMFGEEHKGRSSFSSNPELYRTRTRSKSPPSMGFERKPVPQIVEVPPTDDLDSSVQPARPSSAPSVQQQQPLRHPERVSSREEWNKTPSPQRPGMPSRESMHMLTNKTQIISNNLPPQSRPSQTLEQPSPLPGNDTNTSNLSFIPTLTVDKRADNKKKEDASKKSGWSWGSLVGKQEGDKEKSEKPKAKILKPPQQHDNTRLDVLQTSIEGNKGRESIVLDREGLRLEEERKKESQRKSAGSDGKKEKEGLFASLFGGKKSKGDKEEKSRKYRDRGLSPEPPYRELRPDVDYNWARFSILEERAIYRMAHIKLANPRRALYSQVLLSNFMYSYLAKVQQMHPQMNLPTSAKQQRKQQSTKDQQPQQRQPEEYTQYQRYQQQQEQLQSGQQTSPAQQDAGGDEHDRMGQASSSRDSNYTTNANEQPYTVGGHSYSHHQQQSQGLGHNRSRQDNDADEMW
ncbi:hypothetical protein PV10_06484 [Exophiala mesophila]|uniref:Protein Zds1 C-terminal domain-containing protein n=2 Tax=Exophiala mesophila TaxID=212818 RepID=A0A0D1ZBF9_EXOME|nr:uncharacterized protein PV10_06484 [Exophiala mesophila]KIV92002.1 hypothetical protein PV10_06484 [Exophiala mesophila]